MNFLKHPLRIVISASIGIPIVVYLNLNGILMMVFFFGIYIVVSMIIEGIWAFFVPKSPKQKRVAIKNRRD